MRITTLEDFEIWQLARKFAEAISAILTRPCLSRDRKLWGQLADSSESVLANTGEGFGQQSDRSFARYLHIARGSNNEARGQLAVALARGHISKAEFTELENVSRVLGKKLTTLIKHLRKEDRENRG